jgi:hypothetical protein
MMERATLWSRPDAGRDDAGGYFFEHERGYGKPEYATGSSLGTFLLLLAESDRAQDEVRPSKWQLKIDPDIDKRPRAPAV